MTAVNLKDPSSIAEAAKARQTALAAQGEHLSFAEAVQWVTTAARRRPRQAPDTVEIPVDTVEFAEASPGTGVDLSSPDAIQKAAERYMRHMGAQGVVVPISQAVKLVTDVEKMGRDRWVAKQALKLIDQYRDAGKDLGIEAAVTMTNKALGWW